MAGIDFGAMVGAASGTALDVGAGAAGGGGLMAGGLGALAMINPYMAAFSAVVSMFSAPSTDISKAQAQGNAFSGAANFANDDAISLGGGGILNFTSPQKVLAVAGALVAAIYIYKKWVK